MNFENEVDEMKKELTVNVAVSVDAQYDLTKVSVRAESLEYRLRLEAYNIAFETGNVKNLAPVELTDQLQLIDDCLRAQGYQLLNSREFAVSRLSDYFKSEIFDRIDVVRKTELGDYLVKYRLIVDYTLGPEKFGDSIKFLSDALAFDVNRRWMVDMLKAPIVLDEVDYSSRLKDPIYHTNEMIRHMRHFSF